jgi:hypothetical protein
MDVAWDVAKQGKADVDEQISSAACHHVHADGRDYETRTVRKVNQLNGVF